MLFNANLSAFLERDLPQWGVRIPAAALLRFWTMLAHDHGGVWNAAEPARSLGISEPTVRSYLDVLEGVFMVRLEVWAFVPNPLLVAPVSFLFQS